MARLERWSLNQCALPLLAGLIGCNAVLGMTEPHRLDSSDASAGADGGAVDASLDGATQAEATPGNDASDMGPPADATSANDATVDADASSVTDATPSRADAQDGPDTTAPTISGTDPVDAQTNVGVTPSIQITFSEVIDPTSVNAQSVSLTGPDGTIAATLAVDGNVVTLNPGLLSLVTPYVLTIGTSIQDLAGNTLRSSRTIRFTTRDGVWGTPRNIGPSGDSPQIGFDAQGRALVLWEQLPITGPPCGLVAASYVQGSGQNGWSTLSNMPQASGRGVACKVQNIAGDQNGTFAFSWYFYDELWSQTYDTTAGFSAVHQYSSGYHSGTALSHGHGWTIFGNGFPGIWASEYAAGMWGDNRQILPPQTDAGPVDQTPDGGRIASLTAGPAVIADDQGNTLAIFGAADDTSSNLYAARTAQSQDAGNAPSRWLQPEVLASFDVGTNVAWLSAASAPDGHAIVVWEVDSQASAIEVRTSAPGLGWTNARTPWAILAGTGLRGYPMSPRVAAGASDDALAIWVQTDSLSADGGIPARVWGSFLASRAADWSAPVPLSSADGTIPPRPASVSNGERATAPVALTADRQGNGIAAWIELDSNSNATVQNARFIVDSGWGRAAPISGSTVVGGGVQIASDRWGRAIAVWVGPAGGIWAARFE